MVCILYKTINIVFGESDDDVVRRKIYLFSASYIFLYYSSERTRNKGVFYIRICSGKL